jgi:hypothetical protein
MFNKLNRYIKDPYWSLGSDLIKSHPNWMSDKFYICTLWRMVMGYKLNLKNPQTFNEKLQWLKLYDHNPLYTTLVDKLRVKDWVAEKIGAQYVIPTLAVYNSVDEIDLDKLPEQFVLKCNHDSGSVFLCKDKSTFNLIDAKKKLEDALKRNFYYEAREWPYKNVKPCIFAEAYMEDIKTNDLPDYVDNSEGYSQVYIKNNQVIHIHELTPPTKKAKDLITYKFLCFGGEPKILYVTVKNDSIWENYYDMNFNILSINRKYPKNVSPIVKPRTFEKMKEIARILSFGFSHIRIDLYEINEKVFFSEYTFYDWGGFIDFENVECNKKLGDLIKI